MKKFVCQVCGYVYEGETAPDFCPQCKAPKEKFTEQSGEMSWAAEHVVGVAQGSSEDIMNDLRANFQGECTEVGMYLAMAESGPSGRLSRNRPVTGKKPLMKRRNTLRNSRSFWAKLSPTAPRKTSACVWKRKTARLPVNLIWPNARKPQTSTQFTIPSMRWQETKHGMARRSRACSTGTSANKKQYFIQFKRENE